MSDPHDPAEYPLDFGSNVRGKWYGWGPDRELNPQYAEIPDTDRLGIILWHLKPDGESCVGSVMFDVLQAQGFHGAKWQVQSLDPLSITPSILCKCGFHGFIT